MAARLVRIGGSSIFSIRKELKTTDMGDIIVEIFGLASTIGIG